LGSILIPTEAILCDFQSKIDSFCLKNLSFAKDRLYIPPNEGGLGLINIKSLLLSQQSIWFKRAFRSSRDNWRFDMWVAGSGNCLCPDPVTLLNNGKIISAGIASSFLEFLKKYYSVSSNFLDSFVLNNPLITIENNFPWTWDEKFWSHGSSNIFKIAHLRVRHFLLNGKLKQLHQLNEEFTINLSPATYLRLISVFWHIGNRIDLKNKCTPIDNFLTSFKKGSKKCRAILDKTEISKIPDLSTSFANACNLQPVCTVTFGSSIGMWNLNCIPNDLREFIFKFFYNLLPINTRVSHFSESSRWCTFCNLIGQGMGPFSDENMCHLFLLCPTVSAIHSKIENDLFELDPDPRSKRWFGVGDENFFLRLFILTIQFKIWENKIKKSIPSVNNCVGEAIYILSYACSKNKYLKNSLNSLNCPLSRLWTRLANPRW
jgi:hypothetical protein